MASRYRPVQQWLVDWDGDGRFAHAQSDVTEDVRAYSVLAGSNPSLDGRRVAVGPAAGTLVLQSLDGKYDPDSSRQQVDETDLRSRRQIRLLEDDVIAWQGRVAPGRRTGDGADAIFTKPLEGERKDTLTANDRTLSHDGGTVSDLAAAYRRASGLSLDISQHDQPVGIVRYRGNWVNFLGNFGRFAGGWVIEKMNGDWVFLRYHETPDLPVAARLGVAYEPYYADLSIAERVGHTRNTAELQGQYYFDDPDERVVARTTRLLPANQRNVLRATPRSDAAFQVLETTRTEVGPSDSARIISQNADGSVTITTLGFPGPPREISLTTYGRVRTIQQATKLEMEISEFDSVDVFGPRPLITPPWFTASYAEVATHFKPWLRNLSQPPEHLRITYSSWQRTRAQSNVLRDACVPGNAVDCDYYREDQLRTTPVAILAARLQGGFRREPTRTLYGVTRRSAPPAPLQVTAENVLDRTAEIHAQIPSPALEELYLRIRTQ